METTLMGVKIKSFIILAIVAGISFGLGYYTSGNVNRTNEHHGTTKKISSIVHKPERVKTTGNTDNVNTNENDPLIHLKMLQKDVEVFKALIEEVKNELFVSGNA